MDGGTILVTGGAGFIGSHLVDHLLEVGANVTVVDDLSTGSLANLSRATEVAGDRLRFREGRVSEILPTLDGEAFAGCFHLAAAVGVRLVVDEPIRTIETNVHETSAVLEFARRGRVPTLVASTSEVYGKGTRTPFAEADDVIYGPTTMTRWSYACSKAIDEYLALAHHRQGLAPTVVVRFFNTVGPRQSGEYGMVLPRFIEAALAGRPLEVHGDGRQARCFCDVRDVVPALPRLLADPECHGRVFNLGRDDSIEIGELARAVRDRLKSSSGIRNISYEEVFDSGFEDLRIRQPDLTRVRSAIDFEPEIDLDRTIDDIASSLAAGRGDA
ncbi:MAG: NAD-dependent epimerase/dehydratase family protein [Phycisphaeraceae bacterium]|nr:NAD-dependent epimerase/dehydratase family protein [Phycisphaeraceae bacterium]